MGIGVGILLIAIGAILAFAVNASTGGVVELHTVGWILMLVGALGVGLSLVFWSTWAGPGYFTRSRRMVADEPGMTRRETTIEEG